MKIKLLSDSTCDLSPELLAKYQITLTPLTVVKAGEGFLDGVTITPADIFAHVAAGGELCSTSAISIGEYADQFARFASDYDAVIQICLGSGFSSCYQNATLAAEDFDNVFVVDSRNLSTGQGLVVLKAAELAASGLSAGQILSQLEAFLPRVETSFVVDKLDYLAKGGRCSSAAALGANLLAIKPCIELRDNKMSVGKKYRGNFQKCVQSYLKDRLEGREDLDPDFAMVTSTGETWDLGTAVAGELGREGFFRAIHTCEAGCTVSCHCGPGAFGVMVVRKPE